MKIQITSTTGKQIEFEALENTIGSEKQINWADSLKANMIGKLLNWALEQIEENNKNRIMSVIEKSNKIVDAKFWIDNRNMSNSSFGKIIESL